RSRLHGSGASLWPDATGTPGIPESRIHQIVQTRPVAPVAKKTHRQLATPRMAAMAGGATTAPAAVPALIIPIAVDRSLAGNHSETALVAAGKPPPSPIPKRKRQTSSEQKPVARPCVAVASDQAI